MPLAAKMFYCSIWALAATFPHCTIMPLAAKMFYCSIWLLAAKIL
jgi:hypothetical protein